MIMRMIGALETADHISGMTLERPFLSTFLFYILQRRPPMNARMQMVAAPTPASTLRKAIIATAPPIWSLMRPNQLTA